MMNTTTNPRHKLLFVAVLPAVVLAIMMVVTVLVPAKEAQAAYYATLTSVKGTVFEVRGTNYTRSAGATVRLWRWTGMYWEYTGLKTTTNSYGQYLFPEIPTNYHYQTVATKTYGSCPKLYVFGGESYLFSPPSWSTGVNATINMNYNIKYC